MSDNNPGGSQSPRFGKRHISHVFFLTPISRGTVLTTEVQRLLGFINVQTDIEQCLVNQRKKPKTVHTTRGRQASSVNRLHVTIALLRSTGF